MWKGDFGTRYAERNKITLPAMKATVDLWEQILDCIYVPPNAYIFEAGANIGLNMVALDTILDDCMLFASEPNEEAMRLLDGTGTCSVNDDALPNLKSSGDGVYDLAFTSGVLIHIPTIDLIRACSEIHRVSNRWIVAIEYFSPQEVEVPYHGENGMLWTRDYGSIYLDNFPDLTCRSYGFVWGRETGLDSLNWWLLEKKA